MTDTIDSYNLNGSWSQDKYYKLNFEDLWKFYKNEIDYNFDQDKIFIDETRLNYALKVFEDYCDTAKVVEFGYYHDSILNHLESVDKVDIVNLDYHHDISYDTDQKFFVDKYNTSSIASWVYWLYKNNKLSSYDWIGTPTSLQTKESVGVPRLYNFFSDYSYKFSDSYDYIFICLSPEFIPPKFWYVYDKFVAIASKHHKNIGFYNDVYHKPTNILGNIRANKDTL